MARFTGRKNRFGQDEMVGRLNSPKNDDGSGSLREGFFEIGNQLFRITVTEARERKSDRHVGWFKIEKRPNRGGGGNYGGRY